MKDESKSRVTTSAAAALLQSMRVVEQALAQPSGLSSEQLTARVREWRQLDRAGQFVGAGGGTDGSVGDYRGPEFIPRPDGDAQPCDGCVNPNDGG